MAKLSHGILGPLTGKIGNLIAQKWKKVTYLRPASKKSTKPKTAGRLENEAKFAFFNNWLKPLYPYFQVGFKNMATEKTELNIGFSENYRRALSGSSPNFVIDYEKVVISIGPLPGIKSVILSRSVENELILSWDGNNFNLKSSYNDQLFLVAYAPDLKSADGFIGGIRRTSEKHTFKLFNELRTYPLEIYIGLCAFNGKKVSNSQYLGRLEPNDSAY